MEPLYEESKPSYDGGGTLFLLLELESLRLVSGSLDLYLSPVKLALSYSISEQVKLSLPLSSVVDELWWVSGTGEWCMWFKWLETGTRGASLELDTASNVDTKLEVLGLAFSRSISSAVRPMPGEVGVTGGGPVTFLLLELCPLSCDITGLLRLRSLLLWRTSFPTPPELEVVASRALCSGFPLISCNVNIRGC